MAAIATEHVVLERCPNCDGIIGSHLMEQKNLPTRFYPARRVSILCIPCRRVFSIIQRKTDGNWRPIGAATVMSSGSTFNRLMERHRQFTGQ